MSRIWVWLVAAFCIVPALAVAQRAPQVATLAEVLAPGEDWKVAVEALGFADGLSYDAAGNVYFADLRGPNAGVYRLAPDGAKTQLTAGGRSGTRPGPDGRLYACGRDALVAINPADGKVTPVAEG